LKGLENIRYSNGNLLMIQAFHQKLEATVGSLEDGCIGTVKLMSCGFSEREAKDALANGCAYLIEELQSKILFLRSELPPVEEEFYG
jgi:hypothetical protein